MPRRTDNTPPAQETKHALRQCRFLILCAVGFGVAINVLLLTGPLYMLQIYDRVLTSASVETLFALTFLMIGAYVALGLIDAARAMVAAKVGLRVERLLGERLVAGAWLNTSDRSMSRGSNLLRDLDTYRNFIGGPGLVAGIDLPFAPLFIAVIYLLHPFLGLLATAAVVVLTSLTLITQLVTRTRLSEAQQASVKNMQQVLNVASASESVRTLGMTYPLLHQWRDERDSIVSAEAVATDRASTLKSAAKAARLMVQSLILGLGAWLVLQNQLTPGGMIAASIILGRALAPIEQALAIWTQFNAARTARASIDVALEDDANQLGRVRAQLPSIQGHVQLDDLTYIHRGSRRPLLRQLSLTVPAGISVGIIGPSGVGKSTLGRLIIGALHPTSGCVRLDGADISHYDPSHLGSDLGYLSQDVGLLPGTIADNISRFAPGQHDGMIEAARRAQAHDMILRLPNGYDTVIGELGHGLSGGQRQRIGLARALFGRPRLILLDEPNSNLDDVGEAALLDAIQTTSDDGATLFVITHKMSILEMLDTLIVLRADGTCLYGPRQPVLDRLARMTHARPTNQLTSSATGGADET